MLSTDKIPEIYYEVDEFFKAYSNVLQSHSIESDSTKKKCNRKSTLNASEVMTILNLFYDSGFRCLKHYYIDYVKVHMQKEVPKTVSYNRFVELQKTVIVPLGIFLKTNKLIR